jgi:DNA polymerase-3 subunit epsilon
MDRDLEDLTFIAFDTETTGLYPVMDRLVEIGAVRFGHDGEEIAVFEQLINPDTSIPPEAQQVNHITDSMVAGMPRIEAVLPRFLDFVGSSESILIAHNAPFDIGFIGVDLLRLGLGFPLNPVFDTKLVAQAVMPGLPTYSLEKLGTLLDVIDGQEHRALADARITKDVFVSLLARSQEIGTIGGLADISPPTAFETARLYEATPPAGFEDLAAAISSHTPIEIVYQGGTKGDEPRKVTPRALLQYGDSIYVAAFCHTDSKDKMYRLDRIVSLRLLG